MTLNLSAPSGCHLTSPREFLCHGFSIRKFHEIEDIDLMQPEPIYIFVAVVPVTMDAVFKYWIFRGLNRQNPAAAATLKTMDRH